MHDDSSLKNTWQACKWGTSCILLTLQHTGKRITFQKLSRGCGLHQQRASQRWEGSESAHGSDDFFSNCIWCFQAQDRRGQNIAVFHVFSSHSGALRRELGRRRQSVSYVKLRTVQAASSCSPVLSECEVCRRRRSRWPTRPLDCFLCFLSTGGGYFILSQAALSSTLVSCPLVRLFWTAYPDDRENR